MIVFEYQTTGFPIRQGMQPSHCVSDEMNSKADVPMNMLHLENNIVLTSCALNNPEPIALRCSTPLDANELEQHGYPLSYCDINDVGPEGVLDTLDLLGIKTIAFFYDAFGPDFDAQDLCEMAAFHDIKVHGVLLPFSASQFACWDSAQWRIFASRLSLALSGQVFTSSSHPLKGARYYAHSLQ